MVEQRTENPRVRSSILRLGTKRRLIISIAELVVIIQELSREVAALKATVNLLTWVIGVVATAGVAVIIAVTTATFQMSTRVAQLEARLNNFVTTAIASAKKPSTKE